jgi:hypothetical protein
VDDDVGSGKVRVQGLGGGNGGSGSESNVFEYDHLADIQSNGKEELRILREGASGSDEDNFLVCVQDRQLNKWDIDTKCHVL